MSKQHDDRFSIRKATFSTPPVTRAEPVAVIGIACRFPGGAETPHAFWRLLQDGVDAIDEVPADRWDSDEYYDSGPAAACKSAMRRGGFLQNVDQFDAEFFGISPREAAQMDPQQRLLMEVAWEALEYAALPASRIARTRTGIYVGVLGSDYALLQARDPSEMDIFVSTGSSHSILANRLSYFLDLRGPSITLDTACSSSLVTVHLACQSLRRGETDLALAGGVNLILAPETTMALTKAGMMARDGHCKAFDAAADGYVRGEGCGMVVLKRLSDAVNDGDRVLAVIRGSAVNHNGRSNGLPAPNGPAQEAVIRAALADAGVAPADITYVEAHGTGTRLGDPIEVEAIRNVLCVGRGADRPLTIASVKTNIGHLESAAGIAGLIKIVLMLRQRQIPPHLHLKNVNPLLRLEDSPLEIPTDLRDWCAEQQPRRAGVSSFGFGGANAHLVLEEAPQPTRDTKPQRPCHLLTLSARSPQALGELATRYAEISGSDATTRLADIAYTANTGREHFEHRAAVIAESLTELGDRLRAITADQRSPGVHRGSVESRWPPRIAFLFTGQGSQYARMGLGLYDTQPTFRDALDRCDEELQAHLNQSLLSLLRSDVPGFLDRTGYTQPVMFALQYALAMLWRSWGIEPAAVMGHSVGEFAAACVAGVFSLKDGLALIAQRGRLMQSLPCGGLMAAVLAGEERVAAALEEHGAAVTIAALNGPQNVVISGDDAAVSRVMAALEGQGVRSKILATSHAFHSHRMDPILEQLCEVAQSITRSPPKIPLVANLTGEVADESTYADPAYWSRHARLPVRFAAGMDALAKLDCEAFLEIGPSPTLIGMGRRCLPDERFAWLPSLRPGRDDWRTMLDSLAQLYVRGAAIDWQGFDRDYSPQKTDVPTYPFRRRRHWFAAKTAEQKGLAPLSGGRVLHPLLGRRLAAACNDQLFESQLTATRPAILGDHKIQGLTVMPGAGYLEMALAASAAAYGKPWIVCDARLIEPLPLDAAPKTVQTVLSPEGPSAASFRIVNVVQADGGDEPSFSTLAMMRLQAPRETAAVARDLAADRRRFQGEPHDETWQIEALRKSGVEPGPGFLWSQRFWIDGSEALSELRSAREADGMHQYQVHPGLLDSAFQLLGSLLPGAGEGIDAYVPLGVDRLQIHGRAAEAAWCRASLQSFDGRVVLGSAELLDGTGRLLVELQNVRLQRVPRDWLARHLAGPLPDWCYELAWVPEPVAPPSETSPANRGDWLIFDCREKIGAALAGQLNGRGHRATLAAPEGDAGPCRAVVRDFLSASEPGQRGIVFLGNLDVGALPKSPDFEAARRCGWSGVLDLVHALAETDDAAPPRVYLVTRGAQAAGNRPMPLSLAQAPVWGLGRVIAAEFPAIGCARIDLDPEDGVAAVQHLADELQSASREDQVVYRGGTRHVARLRHWRHLAADGLRVPHGQPYRLEITARGQLDNLALRPAARVAPGPGQVEIRVRATGLNFRDVLNVLNLYPGDPGPLGGECAGEITAVGEGVGQFKPGDEVLALAPASFATFVLTSAEFVIAKPAHLSFSEAATFPICFGTAHLALRWLGDLQPGQRVLIHAASGGVGLAAVQICRRLGAEVFATAGSPSKRDYLRSLGIEHVMDSRSLDFAREIMDITHGEGIDLVVNSLTGEAIAAGLSVLRPGGRFLELGKTDLWDQERVTRFKPGVTFFAIALDRMMAEEPRRVGQLMREIAFQFVERKLDALPMREFPIQRAVDALRHMARAEHVGKIVLRAADSEATVRGLALREDATYLVTGGLGGLGLIMARWLVDRGARHLVLLGRSGASAEAESRINDLKKTGAKIMVRRCDVSQREQLSKALVEIRAAMPPLRGIFHLAGVLDDGMLREQTRERFDRVMAAKALGAWNLHELTREDPLEQFVMFSSAAALLGSPGQANYAAANSFLDALAHHRRWEKRPALSINWGPWAEAGMAARLDDVEARGFSAAGMGTIDPPRGLHVLEHLLAQDRTQTGVLRVDWAQFLQRIPVGSEPAWLAEIAAGVRDQVSAAAETKLLEELEKLVPAERLDAAVLRLQKQAALVLAINETELPDPQRNFSDLGFDSLTGVEFVNRVGRLAGQPINPALLFDHPTLKDFARYVVCELLRLSVDAAAPPAKSASEPAVDAIQRDALAGVKEMSEAEMDAIVEEQLMKLQQ